MERIDLNIDIPYIHVFHFEDEYFLYNARNNFFCQLDLSEDKTTKMIALKQFLEMKDDKTQHVFISSDQLLPLVNYHEEHILDRKLILEVTTDCTLRCKYCFFTQDTIYRPHSNQKMSLEVAKKAIDLYYSQYKSVLENISDKKRKQWKNCLHPCLLWWGGEPLLNFSLIEDSYSYIRNLSWEDYGIKKNDLKFQIITNLTCIDEKIIHFIVNNNIYLAVSLDGDKQSHDKNRVFPNGKGSFEIVIKNLNYLIQNYPDYCRHYLSVESVRARNINHKEVIDYFNNIFFDSTNCCRIAYIDFLEQQIFGKEDIYREDSSQYCLKLKDDLVNWEKLSKIELFNILRKDPIYYQELNGIFSLEKKLFFSFDEKMPINCQTIFSCELGYYLFFVDVKGDIHICNKVENTRKIGCIQDKGIVKEKLVDFYKDYLEKRKKCDGCWAFRFCSICPAMLLENKKFRSISNDECINAKSRLKTIFFNYIILQKHEKLYDWLHEYIEIENEKRVFSRLSNIYIN